MQSYLREGRPERSRRSCIATFAFTLLLSLMQCACNDKSLWKYYAPPIDDPLGREVQYSNGKAAFFDKLVDIKKNDIVTMRSAAQTHDFHTDEMKAEIKAYIKGFTAAAGISKSSIINATISDMEVDTIGSMWTRISVDKNYVYAGTRAGHAEITIDKDARLEVGAQTPTIANYFKAKATIRSYSKSHFKVIVENSQVYNQIQIARNEIVFSGGWCVPLVARNHIKNPSQTTLSQYQNRHEQLLLTDGESSPTVMPGAGWYETTVGSTGPLAKFRLYNDDGKLYLISIPETGQDRKTISLDKFYNQDKGRWDIHGDVVDRIATGDLSFKLIRLTLFAKSQEDKKILVKRAYIEYPTIKMNLQ